MSWFDVLPAALVLTCWLLLPGLLITYLIGLRGVAAWGFAPLISTGTVGLTAVVCPLAGVAWGPVPPAVATLGIAVVVGLVRLVLRGRSGATGPSDPRGVTVAAALGMLPAVLLGAFVAMRGFVTPDSLSQTFDAVFHYNAVRMVVDGGNGSSLAISALGQPGAPSSFYPAAWHDIASLVVMGSGTTIPVAANVVAGMTAFLAWPLACLLLVRQILGPSRLAMAVTGVLSLGFGAFPWGLLGFGVLWPNSLGLALLPAGFAAVLSVTGLARQDVVGKARAYPLLLVTLVAAALAHPNTVFSLAVLSVVPVAISVVRWSSARRHAGHTAQGVLGLGVSVVVALAIVWFCDTSPVFKDVKSITWPAFETPARAVGEALLNAPNGKSAAWLLSLVVVIGLVAAWRRVAGTRWLVANHVISIAMFVLPAALNNGLSHRIVGYWYNDSFRLAAVLPVTALPAAVLGVRAIVDFCRDRAETAPSEALRSRLQPLLKSTVAIPAAVLLVLLAGTKGMYAGQHSEIITASYGTTTDANSQTLLDSDQRAFFDRVRDRVPADTTVASNPWNGSVLLWSLEDRKVLVPHFNLTPGPDQTFLAKHLVDAGTNPAVCKVAARLKVGYLLVGTHRFWPGDARGLDYPGLNDPSGRRGFQLVDQQGPLKLYRITACGS